MLFATLLTSVCFVSCSDDDDNGGSSSVDNPLQNEAKVQISSVTCEYSSQWGGGEEYTYFFEYDSKSRPTASYQIYDDPDEGPEKEYEFKIDYNKGTMSWDGPELLRVTFTNKGYIASLKGEYDEKEDGNRYIGKSEMNFSYDKDGHLIKQTSLWKVEGISSTYPDDNYKETETNEFEFTWVNGNLISRTCKGVLIYERNGETSTEPYTYTSYFTYGNQPNKYKQYIAYIDDETGTLASGLFGVFSQNLPVTYKETHKEEGYEGTSESNGEFTLNDDGSIKTEAWVENGGSRYYYTYNYQPIGQRSTMVPAFAKSVVPSKATSVKEKINKMRRLGRFPYMSKKGFGQANAQD